MAKPIIENIDHDKVCCSDCGGLRYAGLKQGESSQAVAGGVNVMLSPKTAVKICRLQVRLKEAIPKAYC